MAYFVNSHDEFLYSKYALLLLTHNIEIIIVYVL